MYRQGITQLPGAQSAMQGQGPDQAAPGQAAPAQVLPPKQGGTAGIAQTPMLKQLDIDTLLRFYSNPAALKGTPFSLDGVIGALSEKIKAAKLAEAQQGGQAMAAFGQQMQQPPVAAQLAQEAQARSMPRQPMQFAAHGGIMHGYNRGGPVGFKGGGDLGEEVPDLSEDTLNKPWWKVVRDFITERERAVAPFEARTKPVEGTRVSSGAVTPASVPLAPTAAPQPGDTGVIPMGGLQQPNPNFTPRAQKTDSLIDPEFRQGADTAKAEQRKILLAELQKEEAYLSGARNRPPPTDPEQRQLLAEAIGRSSEYVQMLQRELAKLGPGRVNEASTGIQTVLPGTPVAAGASAAPARTTGVPPAAPSVAPAAAGAPAGIASLAPTVTSAIQGMLGPGQPDRFKPHEEAIGEAMRKQQEALRAQGEVDPRVAALREASYKSASDIAARREQDRLKMLSEAQGATTSSLLDNQEALLRMAAAAGGQKNVAGALSSIAGAAGQVRGEQRKNLERIQDIARGEQNALDALNQARADKQLADVSGDVDKQRAAALAVATAEQNYANARYGIEKERVVAEKDRVAGAAQLLQALGTATAATARATDDPKKVYDMIADNVEKAYEAWEKRPENITLKPDQKAEFKRKMLLEQLQIAQKTGVKGLEQVIDMMQKPATAAATSAPAGWGKATEVKNPG